MDVSESPKMPSQNSKPPILDHAATLAEPTRCRLLLSLEGRELTVSELCGVLQLPQSTVSRHLKVLADDGWVRARREGTSHLYRLLPGELEGSAGKLWRLVREQVAAMAASRQDRQRLESVLAERRSRSQEFFSTTAGEWDRLRDELFGEGFDLQALLGLLDPSWIAGDLACGTGRVTEALAPFVERVVALDSSSAMLDAARARLERFSNVEVREGQLESLPLGEDELDVAALFLALHYLPEPERALAEVRRVLRPGGRLLVVDMMPHDREDLRRRMGHVWLGFSEEQLGRHLEAAGFGALRYNPIAPDARAKGPTLFVATARLGRAATIYPNDLEEAEKLAS